MNLARRAVAEGVGTALLLAAVISIEDLPSIRAIYNEGIADRLATVEAKPKSEAEITDWFARREPRHVVIVAEREKRVVGWASLNPYSHRCAYAR